MDPLFAFGGLAAVLGSLALLLSRRSARKTAHATRAAAEAAGLTDPQLSLGALGRYTRLRARSGPFAVEIRTDLFAGAGGPHGTITVAGLADLWLDPEGFRGGLVARGAAEEEVHVGDPSFDYTFFVQGDEPLVRAVLDAETRRLVLLLLEGRVPVPGQDATRVLGSAFSFKKGVLRLAAIDVIEKPRWLGECLPGLIDVARRLACPADIPGRLAVNAQRDPIAAVRLANLKVLAAEYRDRPATRQALRSRLDDPEAEVRLWAALELGEEGRGVLRQIALQPGVEEDAQAKALRGLGADLTLGEGLDVLSQSLRARRLAVAQACLAALGQRGEADVVDPLARVLAVERGALAVSAARALGACGQPSAEVPLTTALGRRDEGVGVAAAEALGEVGTAVVIPTLRAVESGSDDDDLRRAAREAVVRIQERLTGASPGQLSLAEGESGQLSLTDDERGRVTLHDGDDRSGKVDPEG